MTPVELRRGLDVLRNYYARDGHPHQLNDAQWAVYLDGLACCSATQLETAARTWMRQSRWFPALSDLLGLIAPAVSPEVAAHLAWTTFEQALRRAGVYRGATFVDGAIGETVRQVFGSWRAACQFDTDSPGWAIRRQTFLAVYQTHHGTLGPVTLRGLEVSEAPLLIGHVEGLPALPSREDETPSHELSAAEATSALHAVKRRLHAQQAHPAGR